MSLRTKRQQPPAATPQMSIDVLMRKSEDKKWASALASATTAPVSELEEESAECRHVDKWQRSTESYWIGRSRWQTEEDKSVQVRQMPEMSDIVGCRNASTQHQIKWRWWMCWCLGRSRLWVTLPKGHAAFAARLLSYCQHVCGGRQR